MRMRHFVAGLVLIGSSLSAYATTIVYTGGNVVSAVDGLTVDGTTYDVTFAYSTPSLTFQGNMAGAQDATNALVAALNGSTAASVFCPGIGYVYSFGVQYDGTDHGYLVGSFAIADNFQIFSSNASFGGAALFTPEVAATPEPSSLALLGTGMLGVLGAVRRRWMV